MAKITDASLRAMLAKPSAKRKDLPDGTVSGLTMRIGPGTATWSMRLRVMGQGGVTQRGHQKPGDRVRVTLGEYPVMSIEAARSLANSYLDQAKRGVSPVVALEAAATAGGLTIEELCKRFMEDYVQVKHLRAQYRITGSINVHLIPRIGNQLADTLTREQTRNLMKQLMVRTKRGVGPYSRPRGGPEAARSTLAVLRKMFSWAITEGILKRHDNPVAGLLTYLPPKNRKDRVLSLEEARVVWNAATDLGYPFGPVYQLILLTGCRPGEWSCAKRSWIDFKQSLAVIPASAYKSNHVHVIPLVPHAVEILKRAFADYPKPRGEYIFSGTGGELPLAGWTKAQARMMKAFCAVSGDRVLVHWSPHDLRRTVATRIAEQLGIGGEQMIRRVLGHSDGSVTAIYNRYGYVKEMREVLNKWAVELTGETRGRSRRPKAEALSPPAVVELPNLKLVAAPDPAPVVSLPPVPPRPASPPPKALRPIRLQLEDDRQLGLLFEDDMSSGGEDDMLKRA